jgi:hypothetical protein
VDLLQKSDIELARAESPAAKLRQALQLMEAGFRLKRTALREQHPNATSDELRLMFEEWLSAND